MSELVTPRRAVARAAKRNGVASLSLRDSARLPRVSPAMLRAANIVFSREEPLAFRVQDADYEFRWLPRQRLFGADSVLRLRVGKVPAWLALENVGVFERLRGLVQAQLPTVLRSVQVLELAAPLLAGLGHALGTSIQLVQVHQYWSVPLTDTRLHFHVRNRSNGAVSWGFFQPDSADTLEQVARAWAAAGKNGSRTMDHLSTPVRIEIGTARLTVAQSARLEAGDALRLSSAQSLRSMPIRLCVSGLPELDIRGTAESHQITLTEIRSRTVKTDDSSSPGEPGSATIDVDSLPVTISFDLGQRHMTIAELRALRSGCTLELDAGIDQSVVRLLANGALFGRGQLVAVGEMLCVRITELADADRV